MRGRVAEKVRVCYLGRQQRVGVEALHAAHQLVLGVHHVVHKRPADQEPVRAAVHCDALWDLAVPEAPHVRVALKEETVETLLTDEAEGADDISRAHLRKEAAPFGDLPCVVSAVRLDEVHISVLGQEGHQLLVGPGGRKLPVFSSEALTTVNSC